MEGWERQGGLERPIGASDLEDGAGRTQTVIEKKQKLPIWGSQWANQKSQK
jgi:hypothetical protein